MTFTFGKTRPGNRFYFERGYYDGWYISIGFGLFIMAVEFD
jgi:hypothetical protein